MDVLEKVGQVVMFWGKGYDAGARYPRTTETDLVAKEEQTQAAFGTPLSDLERASLRAGFRLADALVEKDGAAPRQRPEVDVDRIRALL